MTSKRKDELFELLAELANNTQIDTKLLEILSCVLGEIHTNEDTTPKYCSKCAHITYYDPFYGRHICRHCDKTRGN